MKSFKQFIAEMPELNANIDKSTLDDHPHPKSGGPYAHDEYHGPAGEYDFYSRRYASDEVSPQETKPHTYMLTHDHDDEDTPTHMIARGGTTRKGHFRINSVAKHPDCSYGADHFYKTILHHGEHNTIESDSQHSVGGASIWHRLVHDHSDVEVTRHDKDGKKIKLHTGDDWDKNFEDEHALDSRFRVKLKD